MHASTVWYKMVTLQIVKSHVHGLSNTPEAYCDPQTCHTFDAGPESSEGIISIGDQEHLTGVDLGEPRVKQ